MAERYPEKIRAAVENSVIYGPEENIQLTETESIKRYTSLVDMDAVAAVLSLERKGYGKIAILNFASYKNPGGMFINGSMAQEEALCHENFLYNVLRELPQYYEWNNEHKNRALYTNRAIYTPEVSFSSGSLKSKADVITCAAPNYKAAAKYNHVSQEENIAVFTDRAKFVAKIAVENKVDTIILGAWGCGVFGQNPEIAADILVHVFTHADIPHVKFAVPKGKNEENFRAFERELVAIK